MSQYYYGFRNKEDPEKMKSWWGKLQENSGWRAELRRSENPADVLLCHGFRYLYYELAGYWTQERNLLGLAAAAGIVSHIKYIDEKSFTASCAASPEGKDKPALSELRFAQLQKSHTLDELYIRMIRAIHLLREKADPVSVADSILHWYKERENGEEENNPRNRILIRWGLDYFQHLPR